MPQRGLAHTGRSDQAKDRGLEFIYPLLHGEVLKNALLDLVQPIVILFQHHFCLNKIGADLGLFLPRQIDQHINVVAHHCRLGRHRRHQMQLFQFRFGLGARLFGHVRGLDLFFQLVEVGAFLALAQFLLDRLDLFVQVILALALFHLAPHTAADALFDLENVDLALQQAQQMFQAFTHPEDLQHFLFLLEFEREVSGYRVGQAAGIIDAGQ